MDSKTLGDASMACKTCDHTMHRFGATHGADVIAAAWRLPTETIVNEVTQ